MAEVDFTDKEGEPEDAHEDPIETKPKSESVRQDNVMSRAHIYDSQIEGPTINAGSDNKRFKFEQDKGMWLGDANFSSAPFSVDMSGNLNASSANISGTITAGSGSNVDWSYISNVSVQNADIADATITSAKIASLDADDITTGTLHADYIQVGTIDVLNTLNAPAESGADETINHSSDIVYTGTTAPTQQAGRLWFDTSVDQFKRSNGTSWSVVGDETALKETFSTEGDINVLSTTNAPSDAGATDGADAGTNLRDSGGSTLYDGDVVTLLETALDDSNISSIDFNNITANNISADDITSGSLTSRKIASQPSGNDRMVMIDTTYGREEIVWVDSTDTVKGYLQYDFSTSDMIVSGNNVNLISTSGIECQGNVSPSIDGSFDLGSSTYSWDNVYCADIYNPSGSNIMNFDGGDINVFTPFGLNTSASTPGAASSYQGYIYYDTTQQDLVFSNGTNWYKVTATLV